MKPKTIGLLLVLLATVNAGISFFNGRFEEFLLWMILGGVELILLKIDDRR